MLLISEEYREQNRLLHEQREDYGISGAHWSKYIDRLVKDEGYTTIVDIGAGKQTLSKALPHLPIVDYDPCVPGLDEEPEPAELAVCTDVLEHIEPERLGAFLAFLRCKTQRKLFFNIATRPALKFLPDGRNAHLIIEDAGWWRLKIEQHFHIIIWEAMRGHIYGEAAPRLDKCPRETFKRPTERRPTPADMTTMFDHIRRQAGLYNDAFMKIDTIRMWEGVDDEVADMQCVANLIEDWPDPDECLQEICRYAYKSVMLSITLGDGRTSADWRKILERRLRIAEFYDLGDKLLVIGGPTVGVQGVLLIGAVGTDQRWAQLEAAAKRITKRIKTAPAHDRRAILACYGPSLESTLGQMRREREETGAVMVSVSGAHDFLLKHGIVPDYHVECDPRPHKADNIDKGHPDVKYLLASCVHPVLLDKLEGFDVRLWHVSTAEHTPKLIDEMGEKVEHVVSGGGSVGLRSIPLLYALGYRKLSIYAMDCSFADAGDKQWAGRHFGKRQDVTTIKWGDRTFTSSRTLISYATNFWEMVQRVGDLDIRLAGDGLLQEMAHQFAGEAGP